MNVLVTYTVGFLGYACGLILALACWFAATNLNAWRDKR